MMLKNINYVHIWDLESLKIQMVDHWTYNLPLGLVHQWGKEKKFTQIY